ncbi:MAG: hypothetical protein HN929_11640 [Chloroflexi bacterium]|nr:hypothetical protein [Chloroflexota bacterium]
MISSDENEGTVDKSSLTFTTSDWDTLQTVTVTGQDDGESDGDEAYSIILAQATSSDAIYAAINPADISLTNIEQIIITQQAYLKAPNAEANDFFGYSVAVSGDTIVVGAHCEDSNQTTISNGTTANSDNSVSSSGAVYVFIRSGTTWSQQAYIKASNADASDSLGEKIAISGDTIAVGSLYEDSNQTTITNATTASSDNSVSATGAVYVFVRSGTTWTQQAYLKASNAELNERFGKVALSGDTIVVGVSAEDSNQTTITNGTTASSDNSASGAGAAYVFVRSGTTWSQQAYLKASNAGAGDQFGTSVSIFGDTIVVGANTEASNQTSITNGTTASSDNSASNTGAAYVFVRNGTTWSQQAYLKAPNAESGDYLSQSLSVSGDTVVVGSNAEDSNQATITNETTASIDNSAAFSGAAYVFVRVGTNWSQQAYIKASNSEANDRFGESVSISGDTLAVGATNEDSNQTTITNGTTASGDNSLSDSGAVYVFNRSGTSWSQQAYLKAPNADISDQFGREISLSGDTVIVGNYLEDSNQTTITNGTTASADNSASAAGAVYVFTK